MKKIPVRQIAEPDITGNFNIRDLAPLLTDADMEQPLHRHDYYFLLVIRNGKGVHKTDFTTYPVQDKTIFILRPGQVHELSLKKGCTGYVLEFGRDFYKPESATGNSVFRSVTYKQYCRLKQTIY